MQRRQLTFTMSNSTSTPTSVRDSTSAEQTSVSATSSTAASVTSTTSANQNPSTTVSTTSALSTSGVSTSVVLPTTTSSSSSRLTTSQQTTTSANPTASSTAPATTTSTPQTTSQDESSTAIVATSQGETVTITPTNSVGQVTTTITSVATGSVASSTSNTSSSSSSTATAIGSGSGGSSSGLSTGAIAAIAVVVPIVGIALLVLAGLFLWRKRKARKDAEDLRRKEVEEYGYNPNDDPSLPPVLGGGAASDGPYEMREDDQGYRGWGATTAAGSSARNPSTTMSTAAGPAFSEGTSPTHGAISDTQSTNPLVGPNGRPLSESSEVLGAMGPAAANNQSGVNRGPSNASSSYSAANRSDGSGEAGVPGGAFGQAQYYSSENYNGYGDAYGSSPPGRAAEMGGQPVIRDNLARRATRIENPSHFPQPSAGISQNF